MANITVPLAGLVDAAMLGHLPEIRFLAGVALGGVVFDLLYWSFGFLRMSATGMTAQALGRGEALESERILQRILLLALSCAGLILLAQSWIGEAGFALLSGEPAVEAAGRAYYGARIWGAPAVLANLVFIGWFLGREEARLVLVMTLVASLGNVAFDYLFIVHFNMAAYGAGLATMLSQYAMLAVAIFFYWRRRGAAPWIWKELLDRGKVLSLLRLQNDIFIRTLCLVGSFAVFTNLSALFGTQVLAANNLLLRFLTMAAFLIDGAAYATESIAGRLFGEGDLDGLKRLLLLALAVGFGFAALFALPTFFFPATLLGWLTHHQEVVDIGTRLSPWLVATLLAGSFAYILDGFFLALTAGRALRNSMLSSTFLAFTPIAIWAWWVHDIRILWAALLILMISRALTLSRALPSVLKGARHDVMLQSEAL